MADRSFWKGYLKLSLVTCPVAMSPAVSESERIRFHTVNRKTGNRLESRYVDAVTGKPVSDEDEARGYERGEGDYVILEDDEIEAVALESTRTIDIDMFVPDETIDWIWLDRPHFLVPTDAVGEEAFGVIREAMAASGVVGIARLVLYRRERAVMLVPRGKGIVVWTLRYGDEVRASDPYFEAIPKKAEPERDALKLIKTLIEARKKPWEAEMVADPVQDRLQAIIEARRKQKPRKAQKVDEPADEHPAGGNVVNIMDALRRSIAADGGKDGGGGRGGKKKH